MAPDDRTACARRLDVGFVPAEVPGASGTGAVRTSRLLIQRLSSYHDLTVYISSQMDASDADLPATDRVEYVVHDSLSRLPHPLHEKIDTLQTELDAMERHDLVHSYSSAFIPILAQLETPTLSTLNSYLPVCPKADMMYHGERKCSGPALGKCASCIPITALKRRQGLDAELRSSYVSFGQISFVRDSIAHADDVDAYHALSPHMVADYGSLSFPRDRIEVIPHFYDESFATIDTQPTSVPNPAERNDPIRLLYVGALQDIKGVDGLLRGVRTLLDRGHDVRLEVAGTGPLETRLHELADDLELAADGAVKWHGYVDHDELPDVYDEADVFVYPGLLDEPFGRVLLEALSTRTPILASDVGSTEYIIGDAGQRFDPGSGRSLADAFERLISEYTDHYAAIPGQLETFAPETVEQSFLDRYLDVAESSG